VFTEEIGDDAENNTAVAFAGSNNNTTDTDAGVVLMAVML